MRRQHASAAPDRRQADPAGRSGRGEDGTCALGGGEERAGVDGSLGHRDAPGQPRWVEGREEAMNPQREAFTLLLGVAAPAFTQPSFAIFGELISAWVLCPARHTVTALIRIADPGGRRAHDAYHRFLRAGAWSMAALWAFIARHMA